MKYNLDYQKDVLYKTFININSKSKLSCDYKINNCYIEIAGMISNANNDWREKEYTKDISIKYKNKMLLKEKLFIENNISYLFLFPEDFIDDKYKDKTIKFLNEANVWQKEVNE